MSMLHMRPATERDSRLVWEWANDPVARQASFSSEPISWEEHAAWFARKLGEASSVMYVACDSEGCPVAFVRFAIEGTIAVISINVAPDQRGKGYGTAAIRLAGESIAADRGIDRIDAYIKPGNKASLQAFSKVGYKGCGECTVKGQRATRKVLVMLDGAVG